MQRIESSVTSLSWIPSEAIAGVTKMPFEMGLTHYDQTPPDQIGDLEPLRQGDRFRFANRLSAWIEVEDGQILRQGYSGAGMIGATKVRLGGKEVTFTAVPLPDRQWEPEVGDGFVKFIQSSGGRTGLPAPRHVNRPPFIQISAPLAWTTLSLIVRADGTSAGELQGASRFPRHWVYDGTGKLVAKSGLIDFKDWYAHAFGKHTPWGDEESPALVATVESALERELSAHIMRGGAEPKIQKVKAGRALVKEGESGSEIYLLLDGMMDVTVGAKPVAQVGPGAVLGERALLEGGKRTASLVAATTCRVAAIRGDQLDLQLLAELAKDHQRELVTAS
jgi:Cyclic nucleotide-binding domain